MNLAKVPVPLWHLFQLLKLALTFLFALNSTCPYSPCLQLGPLENLSKILNDIGTSIYVMWHSFVSQAKS